MRKLSGVPGTVAAIVVKETGKDRVPGPNAFLAFTRKVYLLFSCK